MREVLAAYRKRDGKLLGWKIADFIDIISQYEYAGASLMFARLFKSITGFYVNDYIRQVRIMKAQEFLKGTQMTINDIAKETGFTQCHLVKALTYWLFFRQGYCNAYLCLIFLLKEDLSVFKQHKKTDCHLSEKKVYLILRIRLHDTENLPLTWV